MKIQLRLFGSQCLSQYRIPTTGFARHWELSTNNARKTKIQSPPSQCHHQPKRQYHRPTTAQTPYGSKEKSFVPIRSVTIAASQSPTHNDTQRSYDKPSSELNHDTTREEQQTYREEIAKHQKETQRTKPWLHAGSDEPPVSRPRQASAMTKGKLLTTPTRLFKIMIPLATRDHNTDRKSIEPLALLVHPSQPLSYLERLIQAELPLLKTGTRDGREKIPDVNFKAVDSVSDEELEKGAGASANEGTREHSDEAKAEVESERLEELEGDEDSSHTHLRTKSPETARQLRGGPGEGGVETYSPLSNSSDKEDHTPEEFVRWSKSTGIGDFVRDASRGGQFAVEIEGRGEDVMIGVPSFGDRTYYLRLRLRKKARELSSMTDIKRKCDMAAHHHSQRVAYTGFGIMVSWTALVAWLTFETKLGWDVMEPVTYLVGLAGLIGGYGWFLAHNREASYRSAMNLTVTRKQHQLYENRGFDIAKYNYLVEEGNSLRKEIRAIASEYDVDWDEKRDAQDEKVIAALKEGRKQKAKEKKKEREEGEDGNDDKD